MGTHGEIIPRMSDEMDPSRLANAKEFDDDLADEVLCSNDDQVFMRAVERADCPAALLVDLSQAVAVAVRRAVAAHANTPPATLRRMARDSDDEVAHIARGRLG